MLNSIAGVSIPDSTLAREVTELIKDTEPPLLFHHSTRVYYFGALAGLRKKLKFDPELLYIGAMFHDMVLRGCLKSPYSVIFHRLCFPFQLPNSWGEPWSAYRES